MARELAGGMRRVALMVLCCAACGRTDVILRDRAPQTSGDEDDPAGGLSARCRDLYAIDFALADAGNTAQAPSLGKPAMGAAFVDADHGTCITRVTDHVAQGVDFVRPESPGAIAFDRDDSRFIAHLAGNYLAIYDSSSLALLYETPASWFSERELHWDPGSPERLFHVTVEPMQINSFDLTSSTQSLRYDFRAAATAAWPTSGPTRAFTRQTGRPSADGALWAFDVRSASWAGIGIITVDSARQQMLGSYGYSDAPPDFISVSRSGAHVLVGFSGADNCADGQPSGTLAAPCGLMRFAPDLRSARGLLAVGSEGYGCDVGVARDGREVAIAVDARRVVVMIDLATGATTDLLPLELSGRTTKVTISGANDRGFALLATYDAAGAAGPAWFEDKIILLELAPSPRIFVVAHTRYDADTYDVEPRAASNTSLTRIIFGSNWQSGTADLDVYMIELPRTALDL